MAVVEDRELEIGRALIIVDEGPRVFHLRTCWTQESENYRCNCDLVGREIKKRMEYDRALRVLDALRAAVRESDSERSLGDVKV